MFSRIGHYLPFEIAVIPKPKNATKLPNDKLKETEGAAILDAIQTSDHVVVLDEGGKEFTSVGFCPALGENDRMPEPAWFFVIGGAFGFSRAVYDRADSKMALSQMTFTHQMIRLLFVEQLYRACSINRGEKYHH